MYVRGMKMMERRWGLLFIVCGLIACGDPLVGSWVGSEVCNGSECIELPTEREGVTLSLSMVVAEDLTGTLLASSTEGSTTEQEETILEFTKKGSETYDLRMSQLGDESIQKVSCTLFQKEIECSDDSGGMTLQKQE